MITGKKQTYYIRERFGPTQSLTKEGFLLCESVPVARIGNMIYGPGEVPVVPGPDGLITIERYPDEVFRAETIASFNGKPVVDGHPDSDVTPDTWNELAVGVVQNCRRGTGAMDDVLLADLMITNRSAIDAVRGGLREVSCGYDADYKDVVPPVQGRAIQHNILGNHIALVESGRCGPRCAIGDENTINKEHTTMKLTEWKEKIKAAFKSKDEAAFDAVLADAPEGGAVSLTTEQLRTIATMTRDAMTKDAHPKDCKCSDCMAKTHDTTDGIKDAVFADARFTSMAKDVKDIKDAITKKEEEEEEEEEETRDANEKIEGELEEEAPPGTGDAARKATDSKYLSDAFQEAVSLAEIICPAHTVTMPTFDSKSTPVKTFDALCKFRRQILDLAYLQPDTHVHMDSVTGGRDFKTRDCGGVRDLFRSVATFKRSANNHATHDFTPEPRMSGGGTGALGKIKSMAELNAKNAAFYKE